MDAREALLKRNPRILCCSTEVQYDLSAAAGIGFS